jgi:hypothetical protein
MNPEHSNQPQGAGRQPGHDHERRDASPRWILGIVLGLICAGILIHLVIFGMFDFLKRRPQPTDVWQPVAPNAGYNSSPSIPRLQVSPPRDWERFSAAEETQLNTYGWINRTAGVVRLPVERAMQLILKQGLPFHSFTNHHASGPSPYQLMEQRLPPPQSP